MNFAVLCALKLCLDAKNIKIQGLNLTGTLGGQLDNLQNLKHLFCEPKLLGLPGGKRKKRKKKGWRKEKPGKKMRVQLALDIVNQISEDGLSLSIDMLSCILHALEENYECNLFDGSYAMLNDSRKMNVKPVAGMYNAIMAGYFREKKISAGLSVLKQMELDSVKPDPQTYSYLIAYCDYKFISAVSCIIATSILVMLQMGIPVKSLNELRSALVSALASNGQMADAVDTYEEIKESGGDLEPRAVLSLMECLHSERDLSLMLQLLEELRDQGYWMEGCCRVISFCVRKKASEVS
ncbi:hypothetical protein SLEP1_g48716 [Rubroshorea leprosula]|uniref:Pentatricopeptide repeat-containing protein n=1 Tax=Rubroshorea leprosula TaxID=152421 RepID=A0AAV5LVE5_9ROSI|nr:hypothetical protein SLEP1_g48716 [Rubroshorea leprosula]